MATSTPFTSAGLGSLATFADMADQIIPEHYYMGKLAALGYTTTAALWKDLDDYPFWIGYTTKGAQAFAVNGTLVGAYNNSHDPYLHLVTYDTSATEACVASNPRLAHMSYKWW